MLIPEQLNKSLSPKLTGDQSTRIHYYFICTLTYKTLWFIYLFFSKNFTYPPLEYCYGFWNVNLELSKFATSISHFSTLLINFTIINYYGFTLNQMANNWWSFLFFSFVLSIFDDRWWDVGVGAGLYSELYTVKPYWKLWQRNCQSTPSVSLPSSPPLKPKPRRDHPMLFSLKWKMEQLSKQK